MYDVSWASDSASPVAAGLGDAVHVEHGVGRVHDAGPRPRLVPLAPHAHGPVAGELDVAAEHERAKRTAGIGADRGEDGTVGEIEGQCEIAIAHDGGDEVQAAAVGAGEDEAVAAYRERGALAHAWQHVALRGGRAAEQREQQRHVDDPCTPSTDRPLGSALFAKAASHRIAVGVLQAMDGPPGTQRADASLGNCEANSVR